MDSKLTPNFTDPKIIIDMLLFCSQQCKELMLSTVLPNTIPPNKTIKELFERFNTDVEVVNKTLTRLDAGAYSQELMTDLLESLVHVVRSCAGISIIFSLPFNPAWHEIQRSGLDGNPDTYPNVWGILHKVWGDYAAANPPKPMSPPDINGGIDSILYGTTSETTEVKNVAKNLD